MSGDEIFFFAWLAATAAIFADFCAGELKGGAR